MTKFDANHEVFAQSEYQAVIGIMSKCVLSNHAQHCTLDVSTLRRYCTELHSTQLHSNMYFLPSEVLIIITNFLPNDGITDLMLLSRNFNALVTPRLKNIDQEMATMNQSITSFKPKLKPELSDCEWIPQLNLERFEPIGFVAKRRMKEAFKRIEDAFLHCSHYAGERVPLERFKERMSLERFKDATFLRIFSALVSRPKFREEYKIRLDMSNYIHSVCEFVLETRYSETCHDLKRIWSFYDSDR
ncbi:hypothetical protein DdX_14672 [Ditylenchus destructor]|uniref:F-box domain-containing protein n=1 Tax=Ditylenchus destructor TaxID=166010 RepID=A0AAD4MSX3_9BILA|nr:hypothetical protein DdX_14672 [Ditylenchus destructor]